MWDAVVTTSEGAAREVFQDLDVFKARVTTFGRVGLCLDARLLIQRTACCMQAFRAFSLKALDMKSRFDATPRNLGPLILSASSWRGDSEKAEHVRQAGVGNRPSRVAVLDVAGVCQKGRHLGGRQYNKSV